MPNAHNQNIFIESKSLVSLVDVVFHLLSILLIQCGVQFFSKFRWGFYDIQKEKESKHLWWTFTFRSWPKPGSLIVLQETIMYIFRSSGQKWLPANPCGISLYKCTYCIHLTVDMKLHKNQVTAMLDKCLDYLIRQRSCICTHS